MLEELEAVKKDRDEWKEECATVCDDVFAELGKYDGGAADICGDKIRERSNAKLSTGQRREEKL